MSHVSFSDLRAGAYCLRKLYYDRECGDRSPPDRVEKIRELAYRYPDLLDSRTEIAATEELLAVDSSTHRETLAAARSRLQDERRWDDICNPTATNRLVTGRDCRGYVHKVLTEPLEPTLISTGTPPEIGVWASQSVHAVAAAKALAWGHQTPVERAWIEYPATGAIRRVKLTTPRKVAYKRTLEAVRDLEGPPARTDDRGKCDSCEYVEKCGVRTRTLRSILGFG